MRWKFNTNEDWHDWFAWHPVKLSNGTWIWLETIQRKMVWAYYWEDYEYRLNR